MRLSTSSSDRYRASLAVFALAFILPSVMIAIAWRLPTFAGHQVLVAVTPPPPTGYYAVSHTLGVTGELVLLQELYPVREPLQSADVLLFGTSRSLVALPDRLLSPFLEGRGLSYYHLGFARGSDTFAKVLLEKYDLHPRLVIVDAGSFFVGRTSSFAKRALQVQWLDALQLDFELAGRIRMRRWLHSLLPHPVGRDLSGAFWLIQRSIERGDWLAFRGHGRRRMRVNVVPAEPLQASERRAAVRFAAEIEKLGGRLVLTCVPWRTDQRSHARELARLLNVPAIIPDLPGLTTVDSSHLDLRSIDRFAPAFLEALAPLLPQ